MSWQLNENSKSNGVDWYGKIPEHWVATKLRWYVDISSGDYLANEAIEKSVISEYFVPVVGGNGVLGFCEKSNCFNDTLVIGRVGALCGNVHFIEGNCWVTDNALIVKVLMNFYQKYLFYLLKSLNLNSLANKNAQPLITGEMIKSQQICFPPIAEQKSIVRFLDHKTAHIDKLIAEKERLLKLLEEKRIALITQAVTKGLDPNVKMKPSGIDWLGDLPEHWEVKCIKRVVSQIISKIDNDDKIFPYVGLENIESKTGKYLENVDFIPDGIANLFYKSDVLFGKLRPYLAKVYHADFDGSCSTEAFVLRASSKVYSKYLAYYLLTDSVINFIDGSTYGSKMPRANWEFVGSVPISIPSFAEQIAIVEWIEHEKVKIDKLVSIIKEAISKLKEYRISLITAAVTGKIDVRDFTPEEEHEKVH